MIILIIHIIVSYDQNISLIFYVKDGSHVRLWHPSCVYITAQRQYTAVQGCLHLWNNFPCIITLSCWLYFNIDHVSSSAWLTGALTGVHYQWVGGLQETYSTEQCHLEKILISLLGNSEFYQLIFLFNLLLWTYYISRIMDELVKKAEFRHGYVRKRKVPISTAELEEIYSPVPSPDFKHYNFNFYQTV